VKNQPKSGARTLATISTVCGAIGTVVLRIPLGVVALACAIPTLAMNAKGGTLGTILGIIDIWLGIVMLNAFAGL
jgi:hypothetical protein